MVMLANHQRAQNGGYARAAFNELSYRQQRRTTSICMFMRWR
jgi:hypothetical protein